MVCAGMPRHVRRSLAAAAVRRRLAPAAVWHRAVRPQPQAHRCHICTGTGLDPATSAPGLGSILPHLHRDSCTGGSLAAHVRYTALQRLQHVPRRRPTRIRYALAAAVGALAMCDRSACGGGQCKRRAHGHGRTPLTNNADRGSDNADHGTDKCGLWHRKRGYGAKDGLG